MVFIQNAYWLLLIGGTEYASYIHAWKHSYTHNKWHHDADASNAAIMPTPWCQQDEWCHNNCLQKSYIKMSLVVTNWQPLLFQMILVILLCCPVGVLAIAATSWQSSIYFRAPKWIRSYWSSLLQPTAENIGHCNKHDAIMPMLWSQQWTQHHTDHLHGSHIKIRQAFINWQIFVSYDAYNHAMTLMQVMMPCHWYPGTSNGGDIMLIIYIFIDWQPLLFQQMPAIGMYHWTNMAAMWQYRSHYLYPIWTYRFNTD